LFDEEQKISISEGEEEEGPKIVPFEDVLSPE
jgi:hypothetical protein